MRPGSWCADLSAWWFPSHMFMCTESGPPYFCYCAIMFSLVTSFILRCSPGLVSPVYNALSVALTLFLISSFVRCSYALFSLFRMILFSFVRFTRWGFLSVLARAGVVHWVVFSFSTVF